MVLNEFLLLAAILFSIGVYGVIARRNGVMVLMSIELMAANPAGGSHPSWTANTSWKMTADTNGGMPPTKNAVVLTNGVEPATGLAAGQDADADADTDAQHGGGAGEAQRVEERVAQRLPHLAVAL